MRKSVASNSMSCMYELNTVLLTNAGVIVHCTSKQVVDLSDVFFSGVATNIHPNDERGNDKSSRLAWQQYFTGGGGKGERPIPSATTPIYDIVVPTRMKGTTASTYLLSSTATY